LTVAFTKATVADGVDGVTAAWGNNLSDTLETVCSSLNRAATFTVAASNSSDADKAAADYLCDGTEDQTEINTAIDAAAALTSPGGIVHLCGGTYNITGSILLKNFTTLQGVSRATAITIPNSTNADIDVFKSANEGLVLYGVNLSNFIILGNKAQQASGTMNGVQLTNAQRCHIQNVLVYQMKGTGIILGTSSTINWVESCWISGCDGAGISLTSCGVDNIVSKCHSASNNYGIGVTADKATVTGNHCTTNTIGIYSWTSTNTVFSGNTCNANVGAGVYLYQCSEDNINNNVVSDNGQTGIILYDTSHCNLIANHCTGNGTSANTAYDNISLVGDSDYNNIQCNLARKGSAGNKPAYGIGIQAATCNANLCTNNDLYDGGATGALNDSGTGTVTTAGNRVA
jgi:parallel beta-helix repeat protein